MKATSMRWCVISAALALAGCGGGGGGDDFGADTLRGRWRVQAIALNGQTADCPTTLRSPSGDVEITCGSDDRIEFGRNGSLVADFGEPSEAPGQFRGTWSLEGLTLTTRITQIGFDEDEDGVVEPDELVDLDEPLTDTVHVQFNSARQVLLEDETDNTRTVLNKL